MRYQEVSASTRIFFCINELLGWHQVAGKDEMRMLRLMLMVILISWMWMWLWSWHRTGSLSQ